MHESLDLDRFRSRWVQSLLPFRMPRRPIDASVQRGRSALPLPAPSFLVSPPLVTAQAVQLPEAEAKQQAEDEHQFDQTEGVCGHRKTVC